MKRPLLGAIELGGTKARCIIGTGPDDVRGDVIIPTTTPADTLTGIVEFLRAGATGGRLAALGVASFGPLDLDPRSPTFGAIATTPKPGWSGVDVVGRLGKTLGIPCAIDTDVNGAALGEHRWGAARDVDTFVYLTVGTGIGGGGMVDGRPMRGLVHPEMGHMRVPHDAAADPFAGVCPFHRDCLEGLASGPALAARAGAAPETLAADHAVWDLEARYLALGIVNVIAVLSPERVVIGGGVMRQPALLERIRGEVERLLAGYTPARSLGSFDAYIVAPGLGERAGVLGALALAASIVRVSR